MTDMPEEDTAENTTQDEQSEGEATEQQAELPEWAHKEIRKLRSEAAKYRTKAKELEPLADKARELEDANKSEVERLTEQLQAAQSSQAQTEAQVARFEIAAEKGLSSELVKFLHGDKEQMTQQAEELLAATKAAAPSVLPGQGVQEAPSSDPDEMLRALARQAR